MNHAARIEIESCTRCARLSAGWLAQELLQALRVESGEVAMIPRRGRQYRSWRLTDTERDSDRPVRL